MYSISALFDAQIQILIYKCSLFAITFIISLTLITSNKKLCKLSGFITFSLAVFCILFIGLRDWTNELFGDSFIYGTKYLSILSNGDIAIKDYGYHLLSLFCYSGGLTVANFFLICACLYVLPIALTTYKLSKKNSFVFFVMVITSMSFFSYGVNGIRNGIATSILLLSLIYYRRIGLFLILSIIAISFHKSVILTFAAFLIGYKFCNKTKLFILIWFLAIPLSFIVKNYLTDIILNFEFINERVNGYITAEAELGKFARAGFRYDFVLYSFVPIAIGWYFIIKKHFKDKFYFVLLNTYLIANTFWVFINSVPFSNRFAYLSWFLMPLIILYPYVFAEQVRSRYIKIAFIIILNYSFTLLV